MAETIYLEPILKNFFSDKMSELNFCLPARIENTQNIKEGRIDVKPLFIPRYLDNTYSELPVVKNVPVVFPSSNESGMVFTPKQGDTVLLVFAQCNIDNFKGGSVEPYSTVFDRSLDINDAVAIVGFSPFNKNPVNTDKHTKDYELGDVSIFNNLGKELENKINVKKDGTNKYIAKTHNLDGDTNINGTTVIDGDVLIKGNLSSLGAIHGSGNVSNGGNTDTVGNLKLKGSLGVDGESDFGGDTTIQGNLTVVGNVSLTGIVNVIGRLFVNGRPVMTS